VYITEYLRSESGEVRFEALDLLGLVANHQGPDFHVFAETEAFDALISLLEVTCCFLSFFLK